MVICFPCSVLFFLLLDDVIPPQTRALTESIPQSPPLPVKPEHFSPLLYPTKQPHCCCRTQLHKSFPLTHALNSEGNCCIATEAENQKSFLEGKVGPSNVNAIGKVDEISKPPSPLSAKVLHLVHLTLSAQH